MDPFIKLLLLKDFRNKKNLDFVNQLWKAIMSMNILDVYILLPENFNYFSLTKLEFVKLMDIKFRKHKFIGDSEFYLQLIECAKCHKNEIICEFVGLDTGISMGLFFETINGKITGIEYCKTWGSIEDLEDDYNWDEIQ